MVEQAIAEKKIVRTWPMRGTLHFVAPEDVRWMLEFLTPRVIARSANQYKQLGLDNSVFLKSSKLIEKALVGGKQLIRKELYEALERGKISTEGYRGLHILGHLAQKGLICFGPHRGKQPTFVLLEEWLPPSTKMKRDEALAALAARYFNSHGPATLQDFSWWSGLTAGEAKQALEMGDNDFEQSTCDNQTYWFSSDAVRKKKSSNLNFLLPPFDEFTVSYKDRSAAVDPKFLGLARYGIFGPTIAMNGTIVGNWKRTVKKEEIIIQPEPFVPFNKASKQSFFKAAENYARFWNKPFSLE